MTVQRLAIGLTIWFDVISMLMLPLAQMPGKDRFEEAFIVIAYSCYLLMPLRWALVLTLLFRAVRAIPLRMLPRAPVVQLAFVTVVQAALGVLSVVGWLMLWVNTRTDERVIGFVLHAVVPSIVVAFLASRARRPSGVTAA